MGRAFEKRKATIFKRMDRVGKQFTNVLALTLVWVRVVSGSSLRLLTQTVGGFEK